MTSWGLPTIFIEDAKGFAGGLWILWNDPSIRIQVVHNTSQAITRVAESMNKVQCLTTVYAGPIPSRRKLLWDYLDELASIINGPWMVVGDFKEIVSSMEKKGCSKRFVSLGFVYWIERNALLNLGLMGQEYTWTKGTSSLNPIKVRLDRALCNSTW